MLALGDLRDAVRRLAHLPSTQRRAAGTRACQSATARRESSRATNARKALGQMTHPLERPPARYQTAGDGIHPRVAAAHCPPPHSQAKDLGSGPHAVRSRLEFAELRYASVPAGQQASRCRAAISFALNASSLAMAHAPVLVCAAPSARFLPVTKKNTGQIS